MGTLLNKANEILTEKTNKIIPENIKSGISIFNVVGSYDGEIPNTVYFITDMYPQDSNNSNYPSHVNIAYIGHNKYTDVNQWDYDSNNWTIEAVDIVNLPNFIGNFVDVNVYDWDLVHLAGSSSYPGNAILNIGASFIGGSYETIIPDTNIFIINDNYEDSMPLEEPMD